MAVIDVILYNNEKEILYIRLNVLKNFVDEFIIVECPITFSGQEKPLYFPEVQSKYKDFPINYHVIDNLNNEERWEMAQHSPNTKGATHWCREFVIKEKIKDALTHL